MSAWLWQAWVARLGPGERRVLCSVLCSPHVSGDGGERCSSCFAQLADLVGNDSSRSEPNSAPEDFLAGVSCTSATACVAVGSDVDEPAATRWDGTRWISERIANPAPDAPNGSVLEGVSCTSPSNCIGVGAYQQNRRPFLQLPLVERWDGARWSQQSTPSLGDSAPFSGFNAVSCVSRDACIAVGSTQVGSTSHPLIERWDGATWSIQSSTGKISGGLEGVSCTSGDACTAVGEGSRPFAQRWDGTTWSTQVLPGRGELHDVSCPTRGACVAVGQFYGAAGAGTSHATVEQWDGIRWRLHRLHGARKAIGLNGVACTSPTACVAVGPSLSMSGETLTIEELLTLRARTENAGHAGHQHEWSLASG